MSSHAVDRSRWEALTLIEQLGNIASEVGRSIKAERSGNSRRRDGAIMRADDLFAATIDQLARERSPRLREVLLARDEYLRLFYGGSFTDDADAIERYFMVFAVAARNAGRLSHRAVVV